MFKKLLKKITGIEQIELQAQADAQSALLIAKEAKVAAEEAIKAAEAARYAEEEAKITPKERASKKGEPWVAVINTHVNKDNIRNGFFELDWNDVFIKELKMHGYGFDGDSDEEIVDRWFRDLAISMLNEEGYDTTRNAGYLNVADIFKKQEN